MTVTEPDWWRALTVYVAQMQGAWLTFATFGRRKHPELKIVFTMLAGGAPLLSERLRARGAPAVDLSDPLSFYDTSSYGPFAIDAMARLVGVDQRLEGSLQRVRDHRRGGFAGGRSSVLGAVLDLIKNGTISGKIAKDVFDIVFTEGGDPRRIVEARGLTQLTDMGAIETAVDAVIGANPEKAEQAKAKPALAGWFVGQVMKATGGKASPQAVNALLKAKLGIK